jgi:hypothetical protein
MDVIKRVNDCPLPVELLEAAVHALAQLPDEERDLGGRTLTLLRLLDQLDNANKLKDPADIGLSIEFRLEALSSLRDSPGYKGWAARTENRDMDLIHRDLLAAAAVEPIYGDENQRRVRFDESRFFERVLTITKGRGRA